MQVSHHLLQIYQQIGYFSEAQRVANEVLDRDPKDIEALRTKAAALEGDGKYTDALTVSQTLNDAAPLDLEGQIQTFELMQHDETPAQRNRLAISRRFSKRIPTIRDSKCSWAWRISTGRIRPAA